MKKKVPLVSVVIPIHNAQKYLTQAIDSITSQTLKDFELILVNDASTDRTAQILNNYKKRDKRIRVVNNKNNLQMAKSLNLAINLAKSDLIARMDQDDISLPNRLKTQYEFMKENPKVAIVGNDIIIIDENGKTTGKRTYPTSSKDLKAILFRYSAFAHPTVMFRKSIFQEVGEYDSKRHPCEDIDLWFRLGKRYKFASIPDFLFKYRISLSSGSHQNLKKTEIIGLKIKIEAIKNYGYRPVFYDIIYNLLQFATLWLMPFDTRIRLYNTLRGRNLI